MIHASKHNTLYMNRFAMATVHLMGLRMATAAGAHVSTYRGAIFAKRDKFLWPVSGMKTLPGNHSFGKIVFLHSFISIHTYIYIIYIHIYTYIYIEI